MATVAHDATVLPKNFSGGPHGLGDPNDKSLRKVEREVLIPKIMREKAKVDKCPDLVAEFQKCCKAASVLLVYKCQEENSKMKECLTHWYQDEEFKKECTELYLKQRSEYRATGIRKNMRRV